MTDPKHVEKSEWWAESAGAELRLAANELLRRLWSWCEAHEGHDFVGREVLDYRGQISVICRVCRFCGYEEDV